MSRLLRLLGWVAAAVVGWLLVGLVQALEWRQLLALAIGWTFVGLLAVLYWQVGTLRSRLDLRDGEIRQLREQTKAGQKLLGREVDELVLSRGRHIKAIDKLLSVGASNTRRLDKQQAALTMQQQTLDVVGMALGVKNPRPGDKRAQA